VITGLPDIDIRVPQLIIIFMLKAMSEIWFKISVDKCQEDAGR